jgi:hypothetical protein
MTGIIDVATYVPVGRLKHAEIKELINVGNGKGERSVMNFDEDTTTMAVEAINRLDKTSCCLFAACFDYRLRSGSIGQIFIWRNSCCI